MTNLTFPSFQNPHPFLTSMTPSGSIPSGPPCSLQTKRLQLREHLFQAPHLHIREGGSLLLPSPVRTPTLPSKRSFPTERAKEAGPGAGHTIYRPCARGKAESGDGRKSSQRPALPPSPALPSRRRAVSRELHTPSSAPYNAQAE